MIDRAKFAAGMAVLSGNYNRTLDPAIARIWYGILCQRLTTDQWEAAVVSVIATDSFPPSAARMIEIAGASQSDPADEAFDQVRAMYRLHGGPRYLPHGAWQGLSPEARRAICAVGGPWKITGVDASSEERMRRRFREAYHAPAALPTKAPHDSEVHVRALTGGIGNAPEASDGGAACQ